MNTVSIHAASVPNFIERLGQAFADGDPDSANKATEAANVRTLQDIYRAVAQGDFGPLHNSMTDNIELEFYGPPGTPMAGRHQGKAAVAEAVKRNFGLLADQQTEIVSLVAQGDTVVLFGRERGRLRTTGKTYDMHWTQFFTFDDGKITRLRGLPDTAVLLAAARVD